MRNYLKTALLFAVLLLTGFDPVALVSGVAAAASNRHQALASALDTPPSSVATARLAQPAAF
jgi:hypothetical protein